MSKAVSILHAINRTAITTTNITEFELKEWKKGASTAQDYDLFQNELDLRSLQNNLIPVSFRLML